MTRCNYLTLLALAVGCFSDFAAEPVPTRPLRDLNRDYFPFTPVKDAQEWKERREEIQQRLLVAAGLYPMPDKTPLNAVIHGRIDKDDYTVDKVFFESVPGHFVTGNLYLPKTIRGKIPAIISPHGHWPDGRFMNASASEAQKQISSGAEKFENGGHSPLQARCVQLARMGCAVFFYDMLGYADSIQFTEHRHGPKTKGFMSPEAELNLVSYFSLQTWNSVRAVDFVSSLPYVDSKRIGCTGASGGGTQTMMIAGIDDRIAAAFPCVMVSTAMQGGCTCENANYLRIKQGNVDLAALTAPRPLGMTAADDWTKELETKGFPELKNLYSMLGIPERVEAHFNIQFPHNYNAVSREQMYAFFNKHFKLGLKNTEERDFQLLSTSEMSVWDGTHPKPAGDKVGEAHEVAVVDWFEKQAAKKIEQLLHPKSKSDHKILAAALEVMMGCKLPKPGESGIKFLAGPGAELQKGIVICGKNEISMIVAHPTKWNGKTVLWLTLDGDASIIAARQLKEPAKQLLEKGYEIVCPELYLQGATRNPNVYDNGKRHVKDSYEGFAAYHYGYNPTLVAERVSDALAVLAAIRDNKGRPAKHITVAGLEGAGIVAIATTALAGKVVDELVVDTNGFRFGKLEDVWDVNFVPGAAKYGDLPGWLALCAPVKTIAINETRDSMKAAADTFAAAKGSIQFIDRGKDAAGTAVAHVIAH